MTTEKIAAYKLKCDGPGCNEYYRGECEDYMFCETEQGILDWATNDYENEWTEIDGKHLCWSCNERLEVFVGLFE